MKSEAGVPGSGSGLLAERAGASPEPERRRRAIPVPLRRRVAGWLRERPIVCLLLLTPGIPEYLSSSSSLTLLIVNPVAFAAFLGLNLALYGPGVLLIREALIRWRKGWPTLVLLGMAYAILEEGVALATIFNPIHDALGHYFGVNWIWTPGVLMVHVVYSIGLPILLLGLALPETRGRSLLGRRGIAAAVGVLAVDVVVLEAIVVGGLHYWIGLPALLGSLAAIAVLVVAAYRAPSAAWPQLHGPPRLSPVRLAGLGASVIVVGFFLPPVLFYFQAPVAAVVVLLFGAFAGLGAVLLRGLGTETDGRHAVALAIGLLAPLIILGFLVALPVPVVLVADAVAVGFLVWLWRRSTPPSLLSPPATAPVTG